MRLIKLGVPTCVSPIYVIHFTAKNNYLMTRDNAMYVTQVPISHDVSISLYIKFLIIFITICSEETLYVGKEYD